VECPSSFFGDQQTTSYQNCHRRSSNGLHPCPWPAKKFGYCQRCAGQFNILKHALCWVHAERLLAKLVTPSVKKQKILEDVRKQVWQFYQELKDYKQAPDAETKVLLQQKFDLIFSQKTDFQILNLALQRLPVENLGYPFGNTCQIEFQVRIQSRL
jgi:hypothetical protein